jgi:hypothetical protein
VLAILCAINNGIANENLGGRWSEFNGIDRLHLINRTQLPKVQPARRHPCEGRGPAFLTRFGFRADRKPDPAENFQFIKYGVKMTAMPGFAPTLSDDEIWSLVAFLNGLPGISASDYAAKTAPASGG